jgi:hypothetical protein
MALCTGVKQFHEKNWIVPGNTLVTLVADAGYSESADNVRLVNYYKKSFGFKVLDDRYPNSVVMATPLTVLMQHCSL